MLAAPSYESLVQQLGTAFETRYPKQRRTFATGLLPYRPESDFVRREILPHVEYLDRVSADYVDFFSVGYNAHAFTGPKPENVICQNTDSWWTFSGKDFYTFTTALESDYSVDKLRWRYSGEADLLMMNAVYHPQLRQAELGFETVMTFNVERALADKTFSSFSNLITEFSRLLQNQDPHDPVYRLSDQLALKVGSKSILARILDLLPYKLGDTYNKLAHFATQHGT